MSAKSKLAANILKALGKSGKTKKEVLEAKSLKELKLNYPNMKKMDDSAIDILRKALQDDKIAREKAKNKNVTKTLEKEKIRQLNVNKNQKSGGGVNTIVRGDESKDALRTAPKTQKELKAEGAVSGPSSMAFMAALKGKAKGLAEQVKKKKKLYDALSTSDKRGEKGQLLQNAIKDMQKKLKGQAPIRTLRDANLLNKGGLATPKPNQTGLQKLPTAVRNKMGYMYGGGMAKKKRTGSMDYRKGGLIIMISEAKTKKGRKG